MKQQIKAFAFILGMFIFGFTGFFKQMSGMDANTAAFVRVFIGMVTLGMIALVFKREVLATNMTHFSRCALWGAMMGIMILSFFKLIEASNQSLAIILAFGGQGIWFPLYVKYALPNEAKKTRWGIYLASTLLTTTGLICAVGGASGYEINVAATVFYGFICSFVATVYFISGRLFFFSENTEERKILSYILPEKALQKLERDEKHASQALSPFWKSYQNSFFQSVGMCLVTASLIPDTDTLIKVMHDHTALFYGILLGVGGLAIAIQLITWSDTPSDAKEQPLSTKFKGISQQVELIIALLIGSIFLDDKLGAIGWVGVFILTVSYILGVLCSQKKEICTTDYGAEAM